MGARRYWFALTDKGRHRRQNEDSLLADSVLVSGHGHRGESGGTSGQGFALFAVADGMGGHEDGALASRNALSLLYRELTQSLSKQAFQHLEQELPVLLVQCFRSVHEKISALGEGRILPMGTTLTALVLGEDHGFVAHAGDSQLWCWAGGHLRLLTQDHNAAWGAKTGEGRSVLTSCIGGGMSQPRIDTQVFPLSSGDVFLLNSDGLVESLRDKQMEAVFKKSPSLEDCGQGLLTLALEKSTDNVSLLLIQV